MASISSGASPSEVFIATATGAKRQQRLTKLRSSMVNTATDAAIAMNSVRFMDLLSGTKNTVDVKTYTRDRDAVQSPTLLGDNASDCVEHDDGTPDDSGSWTIWLFGKGDNDTGDLNIMDSDLINHDSLPPKQSKLQPNNMACGASHNDMHETVTEYVGRLWFLPDSKGGIKFRETIRVLSISDDGQSSALECTTQYYNGSRWVDCSKIICNFFSMENEEKKNGVQAQQHQRKKDGNNLDSKVKMTLDCELLVWLPLPQAASNAVGKKIRSVFEGVAVDFFEDLAAYS